MQSERPATARLIRPDGTLHRQWETDRPDLAEDSTRNYPIGWRVEISEDNETTTDNQTGAAK